MNPGNDTVTLSVYGCDMPLHGTFTIGGTGADFASLSEAIQVANFCSVDGPVTFVIQDGEYYDLTIGGIIPGSDSINTITFKAINRENVILKGMTNVITLTNTSHLIFDNLTIDAYDIMYGVILYGSCSDIEIRNCNIILDTATSLQQSGIYFNNTANLNSGIRVIHNTINGGYYGIYFNGGSTTLGHSTAYVIDSNTLTNQYFYAIYTAFVDFESVSYNNISARTLNENTSWYGIRLYYSFTPKVMGNKVYCFSNQITNLNGIYLFYMNDAVPSLVANNEVILTCGTGTNSYGLNVGQSNINFYHNSVLMLGKGAGRAFIWQIPQAIIQSKTIILLL
jgi:hypothetical protein